MSKKMRFRRKNGLGLKIHVRDTANGWPNLQAVDAMKTAMSHAVNSHDLEGQSKVSTHAAASEFNQFLATFPHNVIAKIAGFSPWRIKKNSIRHRGRRG